MVYYLSFISILSMFSLIKSTHRSAQPFDKVHNVSTNFTLLTVVENLDQIDDFALLIIPKCNNYTIN